MAVHKYIKKPTVVEAVKWDGTNSTEVLNFCNGKATTRYNTIILSTGIGKFPVKVGNYLVKGIDDEIHPSDPDIFLKKYEPID